MRYGAAPELAVVDKNVTKRVPALIRLPRVGQPLAGKDADCGEYDMEATPASTNTEANFVASRLSELTISRVITGKGQNNPDVPPDHLPSLGLASIHDLTAHPLRSNVKIKWNLWVIRTCLEVVA
jgi:hypothetical protein